MPTPTRDVLLLAALTGAASGVAALSQRAAAQQTPSRATELTVFAAASLSDAFRELATTFERQRPGVRVRFNFAGSQQIAVQLTQGARADILATADERWMTYAVDRDLVSDRPVVFARNRLVLIVPRANPGRIERLEDLAREGVKLVLVAATVPAGTYSREALGKLATAPGFPPHYRELVLRNVVSHEENVRSAAMKIQLGEGDAALVYHSDVTPALKPLVRVFEIPDLFNVIATYPVARLREAAAPELARAFIDLLVSPDGQAVLSRHGMLPGTSTP